MKKNKKNIIFYSISAAVLLLPNVYRIVQGSFSLTILNFIFILFGIFSLVGAIFLFSSRKKIYEMEKTKETSKSQFVRRLEEEVKKKKEKGEII